MSIIAQVAFPRKPVVKTLVDLQNEVGALGKTQGTSQPKSWKASLRR